MYLVLLDRITLAIILKILLYIVYNIYFTKYFIYASLYLLDNVQQAIYVQN